MADKPKRGLRPEEWVEVRRAYEAGESEASLSRRFSIRRATIAAHRAAEAWTVHPTVHVNAQAERRVLRDQVRANVFDITTRKVVEQVQQAGLVDEVAIDLLNAVRASKLASEYAVDILEQAKAGKIRPAMQPGEQTKADVFKVVMSGYKLFASMTREIAGLKPGMPTQPREDDVAIPNIELYGISEDQIPEAG